MQLRPAFNSAEDRFLASYLHGPLGVIARTDEGGNDDPGDNRHHWYLQGAMGGNVGVSAERFAGTGERTTSFTAYDSFGNEVGPSLTDAGRYTWRGQEGTNHDRPARLVHMQARHYDPGLGRFVQADELAWASGTTQGMNRYIYTENDPISNTDPTGRQLLDQLTSAATIWIGMAAVVAAGVMIGVGLYTAVAPSVMFGIWAAAFGGLAIMLEGVASVYTGKTRCQLLAAAGIFAMLAGIFLYLAAASISPSLAHAGLRRVLGMLGAATAGSLGLLRFIPNFVRANR